MINLLHGDCLEKIKTLPDNSVDAIVTDPPYGISFMSKKWDYDVPSVEVWKEAMRVLKPGGHALIACGTRTQHRMVVNIEDAGFEIRDVVSWIYGNGFPKSLNISKAIDKAAGAGREVVGIHKRHGGGKANSGSMAGELGTESNLPLTAPATEAEKQWDGWGTALKPSSEFFTLCRKPLSEKTIAANVLKWGTGGINIDACRVGTEGATSRSGQAAYPKNEDGTEDRSGSWARTGHKIEKLDQGRFPANLIHDGSQQVLDLFPETKPSKSGGVTSRTGNGAEYGMGTAPRTGHNDQGSAARFFKTINDLDDVTETDFGNMRAFYCAKASKKDRDEGNNHPTVKPTALMQYLCRLITPAGGTVLDPYMGSGSTGKAAVKEGFDFIGCELDEDYYNIAKARIKAANNIT